MPSNCRNKKGYSGGKEIDPFHEIKNAKSKLKSAAFLKFVLKFLLSLYGIGNLYKFAVADMNLVSVIIFYNEIK